VQHAVAAPDGEPAGGGLFDHCGVLERLDLSAEVDQHLRVDAGTTAESAGYR
jgi:hypothetical protein